MFAVYLGCILTTLLWLKIASEQFAGIVSVHLCGQCLALVYSAVCEFRRSDRRGARQGTGSVAQEESHSGDCTQADWNKSGQQHMTQDVSATELKIGDIVIVRARDTVPADGEVIEGVASVDESAITGESAPVVRESGGDRFVRNRGTRVISDWLIVQVKTCPDRASLTA